MPDKEDDAVLAFLLGSMPSLDASEHDSAVSRAENEAVDDLPALEHVSDISATAEGSSNSDWDAITSMERKTNNIVEAEHEDDCAAPMSSEPDDGVHQEEKIPSKKEENKKRVNKALDLWQSLSKDVEVLVAYVIACVYSFFHPLVLPLPGYEELYSAYGISNVSVDIWKLVNFPTEALHLYGAEVFRYQVSLDDEIITSEIGFLALQDEESGAEALNRTLFKLHLEVTIPIPGLIEELKTYNQDVYVRKPPTPSRDDGVHIMLTSPLDGATFEQHQSIVLEYTAVNVQNMVVLIDDNIYLKKTHTNDGNMLLRGLGVGPHAFEVQALDKQNEVTASSTVHVKII
ncbi:hypothetical protein GQ600_3546 [Phytophthora cactorum]|nr:hypothetical protein GQ600_3546 [Phytophthora cactorum]